MCGESPEYYVNPTAGSSLNIKRSLESRKKMSDAKLGEKHPRFGSKVW